MNVLLVGGSGLIGHYLLPMLVGEGHVVTVVSRGNRPLREPSVMHIRGNRTDIFASQRVPGHYDVVIDDVAYTPDDCKTLLNSLRGRMNHYIVVSTAFVYPNLTHRTHESSHPIRETDALFDTPPYSIASQNPHDRYVYDKQRMEFWLRHHTADYNIPVTVIRPLLQIVGPNTDDGRFAWFWLRVRDGGRIWLPEDARQNGGLCQLSFSGDVARTIVAAMHHSTARYTVYNAGQPELWTCEEYIRLMTLAAGNATKISYAPRETLDRWVGGTYRIPLPYQASFDVSRAWGELGLVPTPMEIWIRETGDWMTQFYADSTPNWYESRRQELLWQA